MDVVVKGRRCEVTDRYRQHVEDKLSRLEKYDQKVMRVDVVVTKERNPRLADRAIRVELTVRSRGPVMRAEAAAADKMGALDLALDRLQARLRKAADRRRVHHGNRRPLSVAEATSGLPTHGDAITNGVVVAQDDADDERQRRTGRIDVDGDGPLVVREKTHRAAPMTLDQALYEMELVGHDFFLFVDKETERPSVVYRRRGYDYGVISLVDAAD